LEVTLVTLVQSVAWFGSALRLVPVKRQPLLGTLVFILGCSN